MIQGLKKATSFRVSSSQKLSEIQHENYCVLELKD